MVIIDSQFQFETLVSHKL